MPISRSPTIESLMKTFPEPEKNNSLSGAAAEDSQSIVCTHLRDAQTSRTDETVQDCWKKLESKRGYERSFFQKLVSEEYSSRSHRYGLMRFYDHHHIICHPFGAHLDQMVDSKRITPSKAEDIISTIQSDIEDYQLYQALLELGLSSNEVTEITLALELYSHHSFKKDVQKRVGFHAFDHLLKICAGISRPNFLPTLLYNRHILEPSKELPVCFDLTPLDRLRAENSYLHSRSMKAFALKLLEHPIEPLSIYRLLQLYKLSISYDLLKAKLYSCGQTILFKEIIQAFVLKGPNSIETLLEDADLDPLAKREIICTLKDFENELKSCVRELVEKFDEISNDPARERFDCLLNYILDQLDRADAAD